VDAHSYLYFYVVFVALSCFEVVVAAEDSSLLIVHAMLACIYRRFDLSYCLYFQVQDKLYKSDLKF
jgi:hypothetical protein